MDKGLFAPALAWILILFFSSPAIAVHEKTAEERIETLSSRVEALEKKVPGIEWIENLTLHGLIEAEASYTRLHPAGADSSRKTSDIILSTMEFGLDTAFNPYASGHILFLWEEDETEPVDLDEAYVTISGGDKSAAYMQAGKFYLPFGEFESRFISDPLTLDLGETNESSFLLGYNAGMIDIGMGAFNGEIDEAGRGDRINNYYGVAAFTPPPVLAEMNLKTAISYTSNIADSDLLRAEIDATDGIHEDVEGLSAFISISLKERLFLIAEYVGALDTFAAGELVFGEGKMKPRAWNTELAYLFEYDIGLGAKYERTDDGGDLLPQTRFGAIAFIYPFEHTYVGLEYLRELFENSDRDNIVTAQVAYEF